MRQKSKAKKVPGETDARKWEPAAPLTAEDARCPVCSLKYVEPVKLDCVHRICSKCLVEVKLKANVACPVCRKPIFRRRFVREVDKDFEDLIKDIEVPDDLEPLKVRDLMLAKQGEVRSDLMATLTDHERDLEEQRRRREQEEEQLSTPLISMLQEEETKAAQEAEERRSKQLEDDFKFALAESQRLQVADGALDNGMDVLNLDDATAMIAQEDENKRKKQEEEDRLLALKLQMEDQPSKGDDVQFLSISPAQKTSTSHKFQKLRRLSEQPKPTTAMKNGKSSRKRVITPNMETPRNKKAKPSFSPGAATTDNQVPITNFFCSTPPVKLSASPKPSSSRRVDSAGYDVLAQTTRSPSTPDSLLTPKTATSSTPRRVAAKPAQSPELSAEELPPRNIMYSARVRKLKVHEWLKSDEYTPPNVFSRQYSSPTEPAVRNTKLFSFLDATGSANEYRHDLTTYDEDVMGLDTINPSPEKIAEQKAAWRRIEQEKADELLAARSTDVSPLR